MLSSKTLIVWLLALFVTYASATLSTLNKALEKTLVKHYNYPTKNIPFSHLSYNETHLVYGLYSDSDSEKNYKVTLDNFDNTSKSLSCDVIINDSDKDSPKIVQKVTVSLLLYDRALVLSKEGPTVKLTNVNFHGCGTNEAELAVDEDQHIFGINVVAYEKSYDLFFANSKLCQARPCRITFGNDGKVVKDAVAWGSDYDNQQFKDLGVISTITRHSPVTGFIIKNAMNVHKKNIFLVENDGNKIFEIETVKDASDVTVSTVNKDIGTCLSTWIDVPPPLNVLRKLECKKFDFEGNFVKTELQVNTSSLVGGKKRIERLARLNLMHGFILFTVLCPENYYGVCTGEESYVAYHIDGNGRTLKTIEINDFKCDEGIGFGDPRAFEYYGRRCVTFECGEYPIHKASLGLRCFTAHEL